MKRCNMILNPPVINHFEQLILAERTKSLSEIELVWDSQREVLIIYGGIAQIAGVWAFALGGHKPQGKAWRVNYSGDWEVCAPQEMPCFPWLVNYEAAQPWLASIPSDIRPFWDQGLTASMVLNHLVKSTGCAVSDPELLISWCQARMADKSWDELRDILFLNDFDTEKASTEIDSCLWPTQQDIVNADANLRHLRHSLLKNRPARSLKVKDNLCQLEQKSPKPKVESAKQHQAHILNFPRKQKVLLNPVNDSFPSPPFKGTAGISPITSLIELTSHASHMQYDAKCHLFRIIDEFYFIYHVNEQSEQAMLGLVKRNNRWYADRLTGIGESPVSDQLQEKVQKWLKSNRSCFI